MTCPLCGGEDHPLPEGAEDHPLFRCPEFARAPAALREILSSLWEWDPQPVPAGGPLAAWIHENLLVPGAGPGARWVSYYSRPWGDQPAPGEVRVVLTAKGTRLLAVWEALLGLFPRLAAGDLVQAKRCPVQAAGWRPDPIVVTLQDRAAHSRFLDALRDLHASGILSPADFSASAPPGTSRTDVPGATVATDPWRNAEEPATALCTALASTFDAVNRPERLSSLPDFALACLKELRRLGIDADALFRRPVRSWG